MANAKTAHIIEKLTTGCLFQRGINSNDIPAWQKRGVGLDWENYDKAATNPVTQAKVVAPRRRVRANDELPMRDEYGEWIRSVMQSS